MATVHLVIKGEVQGVFYRATAKEVAEDLQITGWIRNSRNGDVEAMVSGNEINIKQFIEWCRKGPRKAIVEEVFVKETDNVENDFDGFQILRG
ncbi:MAG TPA: acylphosphatase [Chitinophagaceae bacterium]